MKHYKFLKIDGIDSKTYHFWQSLDNNKKATEIWTIKDDKVYIIDYVANEQVYDITVPVVQKMSESFEITI